MRRLAAVQFTGGQRHTRQSTADARWRRRIGQVNTPISLLLVSGSTRAGSSNTTALLALRDQAPDGVHAVVYDGLADLPAFNPDADADHPHPAVARLRAALAAADAVVICTPEYAGTLPGSFKNLLDWTVGTADLYEKPVASINVAHPGRGDGAQETLASVLRYVTAKPIDQAWVRVTVSNGVADHDQIAAVIDAIRDHFA
jgi:chromate reductase, NAD(P)H dehydrogenase (quinone)